MRVRRSARAVPPDSHVSQVSGSRMTGIRLWIGETSALGTVVRIEQV